MKSSCISWPEKEPLILIRRSQMQLCEGDHCAAALLSYFEHWHNIKLAHRQQAEHANRVAEQHGEQGMQDTSLLQFHTEEEFENGLLQLYGRKKIRQSIQFLMQKGFVTQHENPNSRFRFDKTHYFLFHPEKVSSQLFDISDEAKMPPRRGQKTSRSGQNAASSGQNAAPITEISSEISSRDISSPSLASPTQNGVTMQRETESIAKMETAFIPTKDLFTDAFQRFWDAYPGSKDKQRKCAEIWYREQLDTRIEEIMEKVARLRVTDWATLTRRFIPKLFNWLSDGCYDDPLVDEEEGKPQVTHVSRNQQRQDDILSNMDSIVERTKAYEARRRGEIFPRTENPAGLLPGHTD